MKKYFIWGYYGFKNLGDELILEVIIKRIKEINKSSKIYVKCNLIPEAAKKYSDIKPVCIERLLKNKVSRLFFSPLYFFKIIKTIFKSDIFIIGGGGLFLDKGRHNSGLLTLTIATFIAKLFFKKIYIVGVGMDYLYNPTSWFYLRIILLFCDQAYFREHYAYNTAYLLIGKRANKIFLSADILYVPEISIYLKERGFSSLLKNAIGISILDYYRTYLSSKAKRKIFINEMSDFIQKILNQNKPIIFLLFQTEEGDMDDKLTEEILCKLTLRSLNIVKIKNLRSIEDISKVYEEIEIIISMRYHALVFSSILEIPFIGIGHERKIEEICKEFDMPCIDISNLSSNLLFEKTKELLISGRKPKFNQKLTELAELNFSFL